MRTHGSLSILFGSLLILPLTACSPTRTDSASTGADAVGAGAGAPVVTGVTSTPVAQVAKFDFGTQHSAQGGQLQWSHAASGVPEATPEYACSGELTVAIDSTEGFQTEPAGTCPDGKPFYKFTW
jgi:hypothetical protein